MVGRAHGGIKPARNGSASQAGAVPSAGLTPALGHPSLPLRSANGAYYGASYSQALMAGSNQPPSLAQSY
jgi:hypothetical protein